MFDEKDELQSDELDESLEESSDEIVEEPDQEREPSDLAPDSDGNHEDSASDEADEGFINQEAVNDAIAKQHAKYREEERKRLAAEAKLAEYEKNSVESQKPVIPPVPDPYAFDDDKDYQDAIKARDAKLREAFNWEQQNQQSQSQQEGIQSEQAVAQQAELERTLTTYATRSKEFGIKPEELQQAGTAVQQMGVGDDVAMQILKDDKGPLITRYLAKNPMETIELNNKTPIEAILHIERNIKPKLKVAKKLTKTPAPTGGKKSTVPVSREKYPLTAGKVKFK